MVLPFYSGVVALLLAVSVRGDWSDAVGNYESKQKMCCNAPGTPAAYSKQMKLKLDDPDECEKKCDADSACTGFATKLTVWKKKPQNIKCTLFNTRITNFNSKRSCKRNACHIKQAQKAATPTASPTTSPTTSTDSASPASMIKVGSGYCRTSNNGGGTKTKATTKSLEQCLKLCQNAHGKGHAREKKQKGQMLR